MAECVETAFSLRPRRDGQHSRIEVDVGAGRAEELQQARAGFAVKDQHAAPPGSPRPPEERGEGVRMDGRGPG